MTMNELAERLVRLEHRVEDLGDCSPHAWLARAGMFKDDPNLWEAVRFGREWRESQRPGRTKKVAAKKQKSSNTGD